MLLAGLQRQDEATFPVFIDRRAGNSARDPPEIFLACGKNSQIRASVRKGIAETLSLAHDKVGAAGACRL